MTLTRNDILLLIGSILLFWWFWCCSGRAYPAELDIQISPTIQHRIQFTEDNIQLGIFFDGYEDRFYIGYEDEFNIRLYDGGIGLGYGYEIPVKNYIGTIGVEDICTDWATAYLDIRKKSTKGGVHLKLSQGLETEEMVIYVGFLCTF